MEAFVVFLIAAFVGMGIVAAVILFVITFGLIILPDWFTDDDEDERQ